MTSTQPAPCGLHRDSPPADKIALFRSLFRGRDDVYARRFESRRTGRCGYSPACAHEWIPGVCEKPRIKCAECSNRRFLPVTDDVIRRHLCGRDDDGRAFVMGVYPMLLDESCFFLAIDFDRADWQDDAAAFLETCRGLGVAAAVERSRSGNDGHVWLFFDQAVPAGLARNLGAYVLTETMERRPDIGLESYDRFIPNQDTLPRGGFGSLIALPLQGRPRAHGNSVFLDDNFVPHRDQWAFLSGIRKTSRREVEAWVRDAESRGRIIAVRHVPCEEDGAAPWSEPSSRRRREPPIDGPLPATLDLVLGNEIYVARNKMPSVLRNRLIRLAAFQNPAFYRAQAMRLPTYDKPRIIGRAEEHGDHIGLPRGCLEDVCGLLSDLGIDVVVRDERCAGAPLNDEFHGALRPDQQAAAEAMARHDTGVLSAATAFGKTAVAAWLIAKRGVNTLVLVHRRQLLEQWVERLSAFLGVPATTIGRIGGGRRKATGRLDVAVIQSLTRKGVVDDLVETYGHMVVDECHHVSARSFEQVARRAKAKFVTGLSATVARQDGRHPIIFMQCGPVRHRVDAKRQATTHPFAHTVLVRATGFRPRDAGDPDPRRQFHRLYSELIADEGRNRLICEDVVRATREGRASVVLTERHEHLEGLAGRLSADVPHLVMLRGGMRRKAIATAAERLAAIPADEGRVLLATGPYIGEGYDDARLDTLFLTLPVSWRGTIAQYVGRLHRRHDLKHEVRVYDYADLDVPMLARMFERRCRGYESAGYTIVRPASAIPGWPADVPLPADGEWKRDYAASVRRLALDGVDVPLAQLFKRTAAAVPVGAEGCDRARSATEAFLYRRLESLPQTAGRFRLNVELPIAFDGRGRMEVDLLCADAGLAVELDGAHHLTDAEAYRRDRRKDLLLQEHGYFVLRFLAEDVCKRLDQVLDAIVRALEHQEKGGC